uniref:Uncharacterized protein n=1 Tax=Anguilla anguilla TaxID=7936 RepID=A0A0E9UWV8_ANGAN
MTTQTSQRKAV